MAKYRLSSKGQVPWYGADFKNYGRCDSYRFTVLSKDDPELKALKKSVQEQNKQIRDYIRKNPYGQDAEALMSWGRRLQRVSLMARGKRRDKHGARIHRNCDSNLNHCYAREFDVYVHDDTHAAYKMRTEIETGLTPAEQAKIAKLQQQIWKIEFNALNRVR